MIFGFHFTMITVLLSVLTLLFLCYILTTRKKNPLRHIPGPKGYPGLGNVLDFHGSTPRHMVNDDIVNKYGPVCKIRFLGFDIVMLSGFEALSQMMVSKGKECGARFKNFRLNSINDGCDLFSLEYGHTFKVLKKKAFQHMKAYGTGFDKIEKLTIQVFEKTFKGLDRCPDAMDLTVPLEEATMSIILIMILGMERDDEDERNQVAQYTKGFVNIFSSRGSGDFLDMFPWLRYFGNSVWKDIQNLKSLRTALYLKWKKEILGKEANGEDVSDSFIHAMLKLIDDNEDLDEKHVELTTWNLLVAGVSTTQSTLSGLINLLVHYPHIQHKLHEENTRELRENRTVCFTDRHNMPYHYATLLETLRYCGPADVVFHKTLDDITLAGYSIPKGTHLLGMLWTHHHNEAVWGDPFTFRPERYLADDGSLVPADHPTRMNNFAFGAGVRVCVGETFAMTRMFVLLALLIQKYEFLPATILDEQPSCDCRNFINNGGTMSPPPYHVRIRARKLSD